MKQNSTRQNRRERKQPGEERQQIKGPDRSFSLKSVRPATDNQRLAFNAYEDGQHLMLHGVAGTGKTYLSLFLALRSVERGHYDQVVVVRSAVPSRDQGFLPGSLKEKAKVYEAPFMAACSELYDRGDAYDVLKQRKTLEFITTSYVRGITLNNAVVILDEAQNCTFHELKSIITRVGKNCRIIVMGDFRQGDLIRKAEREGILDLIKVVRNMGSFELVEFGFDDILRSDFVKEFLVASHNLGLD